AAAPLLLEPPLARGGRWRGRDPAPGHAQRLPQGLDDPLDRELAVPPLAALVLGDRAQDGPGARENAPFLDRRQRRRGLDVEGRLDAGLVLLGVLTAGPARSGEAKRDLGERDRDRARNPNRLALHGGHSARRRGRHPRLGSGPPWS